MISQDAVLPCSGGWKVSGAPPETHRFCSTLFVAAITVAALPYFQVLGLPFRDTLFCFGTDVNDKSPGSLTQGHAKCKTSEALVSLLMLVKVSRPGCM